MFMLLLHMLMNPWTLGVVAALAVIAVGLYFTIGPVKLLALVMDIRVWFAIAGVLAVLAFAHQEQQNADIKTKLENAQQQSTATTDGAAATTLRTTQQAARTAQTGRIQKAIAAAKPGDEEDAALDAIAAERGQAPAPVVPPPVAQATPKPETPHVQPPPQVAPDRAPVPAPDGVRHKRPDVVVVR
jgi:hypothetical protein